MPLEKTTIRGKAAELRRYRKPLLVVAIIALVGVATFEWLARSRLDGKAIRVSGNIEVTDAELSFKIPGRVETRLVDEGEVVNAGPSCLPSCFRVSCSPSPTCRRSPKGSLT